MSSSHCEPAFKNEIPFPCIWSVIRDVRTNTLSLNTLKKALWAAGCAVETLDGESVVLFSATVEDVPMSADGIAARLEELCTQATQPGAASISPETWKAIIALLIRLIPLIL